MYSLRRPSSIYSSTGSLHSSRQRARKRHSRMSNSMLEDSMQSSNSYSSSQEDYDGQRSVASSWGRPSEYSNYSEDNLTTTSGSIAMTVEEKMKQRMRRKWAQFSQTRKEKATRQWLAYWSIYGTVQVVDTWSSFLLDWIPGYNLGKLMFLWWAQRRGATLVFDYFQPLIQSKNKDGREVARKPSNRSLNSEMSRNERGGSSGGPEGSGTGLRPRSTQMLPSVLAQQQQQQHQQYQQQQFEQQFYAKGASSRRDTAAFRDLNQNRRGRDNYYEDDEEDENEEYHSHHQQQRYLLQQQQQQQHQKQQGQPLDLHRELMTSSPHDSGSFAEASLFESAESVWSAPPTPSNVLAVDGEGLGVVFGSVARLHSNNATPTPMSVQEQYHHRQQQSTQKQQQKLTSDANSYEVASTIHWNPTTTSATSTEEL
ncbi:hypothetical protein BGX27_008585 [Mortierella sp. AM989]|nr:hypothetical protein BGX27_008585 [Mortierella sp. AM989]